MTKTKPRPSPASLDIVVPIYNEEAVLHLLFERLARVFSAAAMRANDLKTVRLLFIDDGSTDGSAQLIADRITSGLPSVLYRFSRNFGHQSAVTAGLAYAQADAVAIIDADLQDPPEVVLEMLTVWRQGWDVISGERKQRKEGPIKVFCYWAYYRLLSFLSEIDIPLDSGDFSLMDRAVVSAVNKLPEHLRFPRGLRAWVGFRQTSLAYARDARQAGSTKYTFRKLYYLATDGITSLSIRPLKVAQFFSVIFLMMSLALGGVSMFKYLTYSRANPMALWFLATYALISVGNFMMLLSIYVLSAYVGRTYLEVKGRPSFIVMESIGTQPAD